MTTAMAKTCNGCGGTMVSRPAVATSFIMGGQTVPAAVVVTVSGCPTCDRPRCPNAGCGMPTGPLLPLGQRDVVPTTCDHCGQAIVYRALPS